MLRTFYEHQSAQVLDDRTIRVPIKFASPLFLENRASEYMKMYPKHVAQGLLAPAVVVDARDLQQALLPPRGPDRHHQAPAHRKLPAQHVRQRGDAVAELLLQAAGVGVGDRCVFACDHSSRGESAPRRRKKYARVRIEATVWAYASYTSDKLDLYYASNANSPTWTFIGTLAPTRSGSQVLTTTYTLPSGALQAVRGRFRYSGSANSCGTGSYDDHDDLIFAVSP